MKVRVQADAEAELIDAEDFYRTESDSVADRFLDEFERATGLLEVFPRLGKSIEGGFRTLPLHRYPYSLIYRLKAETITIYAVAHQRRRPGYWRTDRGQVSPPSED